MPRVEPFTWNPAIGAINGFGIRLPGLFFAADVPAATNTPFTVPVIPTAGRTQNNKNQGYAIIHYEQNVDCWVGIGNGVSADPALTGSFAQKNSMLKPECILVYEGDVLNFFSTPGCIVSIAIFPWV